MKCLLKYQWVKLPRNQLPPGKGIMGAWARLASRAAFRSGQAHYCRYINKINAGGWAGGIVGLKSILAVKRRQQALKLMNDLTALGYISYTLDTKTKKADFPFEGASYKIKTFNEITRLEKNGTMVYESVPGSAVTNFRGNKEVAEFEVEAAGDISFTLEMEPSTEYKLVVNGVSAGRIPTNLGGKLNASLELDEGSKASVKVIKC